MQHLFARAELLIKRDGRFVAVIRLDKDDPCTALSRNLLQMRDQGSGYATSAVPSVHRKVVNVELTPVLLELLELVGDQPSDHVLVHERYQGHDMLLPQQISKVAVARRFCPISLRFRKCLPNNVLSLRMR